MRPGVGHVGSAPSVVEILIALDGGKRLSQRTHRSRPSRPDRRCGRGIRYGSAGATDHSLEDIAVFRCQPGLRVLAPADSAQTTTMLRDTWSLEGPSYYRIGKDDRSISRSVTVETHYVTGGLGSLVAELIADRRIDTKLHRLGVRERDGGRSGGTTHHLARHGLTASAIASEVRGVFFPELHTAS